MVHLEREIERIISRKKKKLKKLCSNETSKQLVHERFLENSNLFTFFKDLKYFCDDFSPDILNLVNLLTLAPSSVDVTKMSNISTNSDILSNESPNLRSSNKISESSKMLFSEREVQLDSATLFCRDHCLINFKSLFSSISECILFIAFEKRDVS